jgi:hypothetical protein
MAPPCGQGLRCGWPPRPLNPTSLAGQEYHLRAFASALVLRGRDPTSLVSLAACLTRDNFIEGMCYFFRRFGDKASPTTRNLGTMLKGVAKHWLKADEETLRQMREISRKLTVDYHGLTEKNQKRLLPFQDVQNCRRLLDLPLKLRSEIERGKIPPHRRRRKNRQKTARNSRVGDPGRIRTSDQQLRRLLL